jgi:oxygen-independent coproporphyrinogen-3 oxidase
MGLRLTEGIDSAVFFARTQRRLADLLDLDILDQALLADYINITPTHLIATAEGRKRLDALLAALLK